MTERQFEWMVEYLLSRGYVKTAWVAYYADQEDSFPLCVADQESDARELAFSIIGNESQFVKVRRVIIATLSATAPNSAPQL